MCIRVALRVYGLCMGRGAAREARATRRRLRRLRRWVGGRVRVTVS
jgi:hypothetical protein